MLPQFEETIVQASSFWQAKSISVLQRTGEPPTRITRVLQINGPSYHLRGCKSVNPLRTQGERHSSLLHPERELLRLACADAEDRRNQEPCFDMEDLQAPLFTCSLKKSPGPSILHYQGWRLFHPKVLHATLSKKFRNPDHPRECSESTSNLSQRKQKVEICALYPWLRTTAKLIDKIFLPRSRFWANANISVFFEWYGFRTGVWAEYQMTRLLHDVRITKTAAVFIPVELKGEFWSCHVRDTLTIPEVKRSPSWMDTILELPNDKEIYQGCFPNHARFRFATRPRRLAPKVSHPLACSSSCTWMDFYGKSTISATMVTLSWMLVVIQEV